MDVTGIVRCAACVRSQVLETLEPLDEIRYRDTPEIVAAILAEAVDERTIDDLCSFVRYRDCVRARHTALERALAEQESESVNDRYGAPFYCD